jgi:HSP20 family protein
MLPILRHFEPLTRRDPLENLSRLVEDFWPTEWLDRGDIGRINLYEDDDRLHIEADMPGYTRDEIQLTLENNVLHLEAQRKEEKESKSANYYIRERSEGKWARMIRLPVSVEHDKVEANFKDGVLHVEIEKQQKSRTRKIEVK